MLLPSTAARVPTGGVDRNVARHTVACRERVFAPPLVERTISYDVLGKSACKLLERKLYHFAAALFGDAHSCPVACVGNGSLERSYPAHVDGAELVAFVCLVGHGDGCQLICRGAAYPNMPAPYNLTVSIESAYERVALADGGCGNFEANDVVLAAGALELDPLDEPDRILPLEPGAYRLCPGAVDIRLRDALAVSSYEWRKARLGPRRGSVGRFVVGTALDSIAVHQRERVPSWSRDYITVGGIDAAQRPSHQSVVVGREVDGFIHGAPYAHTAQAADIGVQTTTFFGGQQLDDTASGADACPESRRSLGDR